VSATRKGWRAGPEPPLALVALGLPCLLALACLALACFALDDLYRWARRLVRDLRTAG
jgi:hypothetical protein